MMATQRERETDKKNTHTQPINKNPKLDEVKIFVDIPTHTHTYIHTYIHADAKRNPQCGW
jgi:hypothetical protein